MIVESYELGQRIDELREGFPALSLDQILRLSEFAHAKDGTGLGAGWGRRGAYATKSRHLDDVLNAG